MRYKKMDEWKTIEPGVWKPEKEGDNIVGTLVNKKPKDENTGMSAKYYIENENGTFFIWGSTVLDDRMQYVKVGLKIRVTYEGKTKNKRGQDVNLFRVDVSVDKAKIPAENDTDFESTAEEPLGQEEDVI
jgi:hypothetical protein